MQRKKSINANDDGHGNNDDENLMLLLGCGREGLASGYIRQLTGEKWQDPGLFFFFFVFFLLQVSQKLGRR